jgi:predicted ArsR family transcriptional regulator
VADREATGRGTTIGELAGDLGGHANTSRAHVARLLDDGLLSSAPAAVGGRGRPAHDHHLTEHGRLVLDAMRVAHPVAADELVSAMAEHLSRTPDAASHSRAIGRLWATQLMQEEPVEGPGQGRRASPASAVERVRALLSTAGFSPRVEPSGDVALRTCPVLAAARAHPEVVCTMHEEMLVAALDRGGQNEVAVRLEPFAREGACLVHLGAIADR